MGRHRAGHVFVLQMCRGLGARVVVVGVIVGWLLSRLLVLWVLLLVGWSLIAGGWLLVVGSRELWLLLVVLVKVGVRCVVHNPCPNCVAEM